MHDLCNYSHMQFLEAASAKELRWDEAKWDQGANNRVWKKEWEIEGAKKSE